MIEWNVYINGHYAGTVWARDETEARLAALHKFDPDDDNALSVTKR